MCGKGTFDLSYIHTFPSFHRATTLTPPSLPPSLHPSPQALASYSTKEEDDARLINDGKLFNMFPKTQRMAIKHRRSEKRLLKKTAAAVKQQLLNLRSGKRKLRPEEEE